MALVVVLLVLILLSVLFPGFMRALFFVAFVMAALAMAKHAPAPGTTSAIQQEALR